MVKNDNCRGDPCGRPLLHKKLGGMLMAKIIDGKLISSEIKEKNVEIYNEILKRFENIKINEASHEEFKNCTKQSRAVIRTGECSPYANIILKSGVVF